MLSQNRPKIIDGETISFNKWPDPAYCISILLLEIKWRLLSFHHVTTYSYLMLLRKRVNSNPQSIVL